MMKLYKHFDFTKDTKLDRTVWNVEVGEKWSNSEIQQYIDSEETLFFDNGLHIRAINDNGIVKSARINTKGKVYFKHGKIEFTVKVPKGKGTWPAVWMMPQESKYGYWPKSGEIDMMEHTANDMDKFYACLHTEEYNHRNGKPYDTRFQVDGLSDDFQTFGLLWNEDAITYYLNDIEMVTYKKGEFGKDESPKGWPFNEDFYIIINLAIGGMFGGKVDFECFPQEFIIKELKIYK